MGKKDKNKKKGKGAEKTNMKTDKKLAAKQKRMLEKMGEVNIKKETKMCLQFSRPRPISSRWWPNLKPKRPADKP